MTLGQSAHDRGSRTDAPCLEIRSRENAGPAVEQLNAIGAGIDLAAQEVDHRIGQEIDQPLETLGFAGRPGAGGRKVLRPAAFDHVSRQGPGRARKADQGCHRIKRRLDPCHRLEDRRQMTGQPVWLQRRQVIGPDRLENRSLARLEPDGLTQRIGNDQDIGEQDSRVHTEPAYWL